MLLDKKNPSWGKRDLEAVASEIDYVLDLCEEFSPVNVDATLSYGGRYAESRFGRIPSSWQMWIEYLIKPLACLDEDRSIRVGERIANFKYDSSVFYSLDPDECRVTIFKNDDKGCIREAQEQAGLRIALLVGSPHVSAVRLKDLTRAVYETITKDSIRKYFKDISAAPLSLKDRSN